MGNGNGFVPGETNDRASRGGQRLRNADDTLVDDTPPAPAAPAPEQAPAAPAAAPTPAEPEPAPPATAQE
jgi:hypothetical protein